MDRRTLLRILGSATVTIAGLTPDELSALEKSVGRRVPGAAFFTGPEREAVTAITDLIIPTTDTPGAVDAGVVEYIEMIVSEWMSLEERERFMRGLAHIDTHSEALTGVRFAYAGEVRQTAMLRGLETEGRALPDPPPFFHSIRGLVLHGYYTSEIGMKEELLFREIPGRYEGCVDVADVTRPIPETW